VCELLRIWTVFGQRCRNNTEKQKRNKKTNIMKIKYKNKKIMTKEKNRIKKGKNKVKIGIRIR